MFFGRLHWESSPLPFLLFLGLVFSLCPQFPGCFGLEAFYIWNFFIDVSMPSMLSCMPQILSYISCILLVMGASCSLFHLHVCLHLCLSIASISIFRSWTVLFISFACLIVFSCISLRDLFVSSFRVSTYLIVFSFISLRTI